MPRAASTDSLAGALANGDADAAARNTAEHAGMAVHDPPVDMLSAMVAESHCSGGGVHGGYANGGYRCSLSSAIRRSPDLHDLTADLAGILLLSYRHEQSFTDTSVQIDCFASSCWCLSPNCGGSGAETCWFQLRLELLPDDVAATAMCSNYSANGGGYSPCGAPSPTGGFGSFTGDGSGLTHQGHGAHLAPSPSFSRPALYGSQADVPGSLQTLSSL